MPKVSKARKRPDQCIEISAAGINFRGFHSAHELLGFAEIYGDSSQILAAAAKTMQDRWGVEIPGLAAALPKPAKSPSPAAPAKPPAPAKTARP